MNTSAHDTPWAKFEFILRLPKLSALYPALEYLEMSNWTQLKWAWVNSWISRAAGESIGWGGCVCVGFGFGLDLISWLAGMPGCLPGCLPGCRLLYQHRRRRQLWKSTQAILLLACAPKMVYIPPNPHFCSSHLIRLLAPPGCFILFVWAAFSNRISMRNLLFD